jgi:mevalonate kinase
MHSNPTGVETRLSTSGKAVIVRKEAGRGSSRASPIISSTSRCAQLRIFLVDTGESCPIAEQQSMIDQRRLQDSRATDLILSAIGRVTESAWILLRAGHFTGLGADTPNSFDSLGTFIHMNHGLQDSLGLSKPAQQRVRELVDRAGVGWSKPIGGRGGRHTFVLLRPDVSKEVLEQLGKDLVAKGCRPVHDVYLGVEGVGVLRDGLAGESGKNITKEMFGNARGMYGIEQLASLGEREEGQGWRFWSSDDD